MPCAQVWDKGARPAIPAKRNEAPVRCPDFIDRHRNEVEHLWVSSFRRDHAAAIRPVDMCKPAMLACSRLVF